jgi:hypothetical protein
VANDAKVEVRGIRDLRKALKDVGDDAPKELRDGLAEAAEIVASAARLKVPHRSGDAAGSIKVRKQSAAAALAMGGNKAPYYGWLDFGGTVGKGRVAGGAKKRAGGATGGHAGSVKRPWMPEGRYIYPTLREKRKEVDDKVDQVLKTLAEKAGFETHGDAASG